MQTHKKKHPAKDLKAIERKIFSLLTQAASNKQKDTIYSKSHYVLWCNFVYGFTDSL